jgi:hypothetical protein
VAITGTDRGVGGNNVSASTIACAPTSTIAAGSAGVLKIALDNAGAGGAAAVAPASVTDSVSNAWTRRLSGIYDPGAASAGVEIAIYTCDRLTTQLTSGNNVTLNFGTAVVAKEYAFEEFTPDASFQMQYVTGAVNTGSATATPTVTTGSLPSGDAVSAMGGAESGDTWAGDADTTNGSWSTHQHGAAGTGVSGMSLTSQRKIVTATATQTYNPTLTSADVILGWIQLTQVLIPTEANIQAVLRGVSRGLLRGAH